VAAQQGLLAAGGRVRRRKLVNRAVESAWLVAVVPPIVASAPAEAGRAVVGGPPTASGPVSGVAVGGPGEVVGSRGVVVDADVGAGRVGEVGSATPGVRRGGGG
jgi:hypothetical protein